MVVSNLAGLYHRLGGGALRNQHRLHVTLETYEPYPGPIYIGISGAFWTLNGFISIVEPVAWKTLDTHGIPDRYGRLHGLGLGGPAPAPTQLRANWPFDLVITIVFLLLITYLVSIHATKSILKERLMNANHRRSKQLEEMRAKSRLGGGAARIEAQHKKRKTNGARRIDLLLDKGSFREVDAFVEHRTHDLT